MTSIICSPLTASLVSACSHCSDEAILWLKLFHKWTDGRREDKGDKNHRVLPIAALHKRLGVFGSKSCDAVEHCPLWMETVSHLFNLVCCSLPALSSS